MNKYEALGIIAVIAIIALAIAWTNYQWNLCMELVGDYWYCLAHIG